MNLAEKTEIPESEPPPLPVRLHCEFPELREQHLTWACERQLTAGEARSLSTWACVERPGCTLNSQGRVSCLDRRKMTYSSLHRNSGLPGAAPVRRMTSGCLKWLGFCDKIMKAASTLISEIDTISPVLSTFKSSEEEKEQWK